MPILGCYNFLYGFKGAPPARQRPGLRLGRKAGDASHRRRMRDRDGHHRQDQKQGAVGLLADSGAAAMSRPLGR